MNDYKELIKNIKGDAAFRHILSECGDDGRVWFDKRFICDYVSCLKHAIEQLVRERDAAIADLKSCCAYNSDCAFCKHYFSDDAARFCEEGDSCGNWEWRGVREVEHETD